MLAMRRYLRQIGFTLVELLIVITIVGIMAALAMPSFQQWVQDAKTRTVAESLQNGIRLAQVESLRRGAPVEFFLTTGDPSVSATAATTGLNWVICVANLTAANPACDSAGFVQGGNLTSNGANTSVTAVNTNGGMIIFNTIGRVVSYASAVPTAGAGATFQVRSVNNPTSSRKLDVQVSPSGSVRMCDADKTRSTANPDGCY